MRRWLQVSLGLALAGLFLWLILKELDRDALADALRNPDWRWLGLGLLFWACGYTVRVLRWRAMLAPANPGLGFWRCAVPFLGSIAVNNVLPLRLGDVLRCLAFSRWLAVDAGQVTATVLAERLLDLLVVLAAVGVAILILAPGEGALGLLGVGATALLCLALFALGLLFVPAVLRPLVRAVASVLRRASPAAATRLVGFSEPLINMLVQLSRGPKMAGLIAASVLVWTFEGAVYWSVAMALPAVTDPAAAWLAMPVGTLATLLPSTPGYIGTFDYFAIKAAEAGGNSTTAATAFAVLVHAYFYIPVTILGGISLLIWRFQKERE